jgi:hypothetical protein
MQHERNVSEKRRTFKRRTQGALRFAHPACPHPSVAPEIAAAAIALLRVRENRTAGHPNLVCAGLLFFGLLCFAFLCVFVSHGLSVPRTPNLG